MPLLESIALVVASAPIMLAAYAYLGYPLLLLVISKTRPRPFAESSGDDALPLVTVVIPAYNEERQIGGAIESVLAQDYPAERRQVLILSDASTDRTDEIVAGYSSRGVELLRMPIRGGKTAAENASIRVIRGEIVLNTDASIRMHPQALPRLVAAMRDPSVGVASTRDVSVAVGAQEAKAEATYVGYEMFVRRLESMTGGIVGASGSGYAIRRSLHAHPVRSDLSRDFSAALVAHRFGFRSVSVDDALCFVPATTVPAREYRRKVRTISRGMDTLWFNRDLLDPLHHGWFAMKLISHKVARWLVPLLAIPALMAFLALAVVRAWAALPAAVGVLALLVGVVAAKWPEERPLPRFLPSRLVGLLIANLAVVHAWWRALHGYHDHVWEPTRREPVR